MKPICTLTKLINIPSTTRNIIIVFNFSQMGSFVDTQRQNANNKALQARKQNTSLSVGDFNQYVFTF